MAEGPDSPEFTALAEVVQPVLRLVTTQLDFADGATVTLRRDGQFETVDAVPEGLRELDAVQYRLGDGPCVVATETAAVVAAVLAAEATRWSEFVQAAQADGFESVLSTPVRPVRGAVNIYSRRADSFSGTEVERAAAFAEHAALLLMNAASAAAVASRNEHLHIALEARERVGEAKGILMERHDLTSEEAFNQLRRASQTNNRKLRDIAEEIIDSARRSDGPDRG